MRTLLLASALVAGLLGSLSAAPAQYQAFCNSLWLFASPCAEISAKLMLQIETFSLMSGCADCQYTLVLATPLTIEANHTSPDSLQAEKITFALKHTVQGSACQVSAQSVSLGSTSRLDGGRNYCNLHNLLTASGLASAPGFVEMTNEWACLGYGLSTCNA